MRPIRYHISSIMRRISRKRGFPLVVSRSGAKFILDPKNRVDTQIAAWIPYEREQLAYARDIIESEKLTTFVDVGANFGLYTVLLGRLPTVQRVLAFEPVRRNYAQLLGNVFANRLDMKVDAYRVALGDQHGQRLIHVNPKSTGESRFEPSLEGKEPKDFSLHEYVPVNRLDDIVTLRDSPIFFKIDVEGHAAAVLRGMTELLSHIDAVLQIELFEEEQEQIIEILRSFHYVPTRNIQKDWYFRKG